MNLTKIMLLGLATCMATTSWAQREENNFDADWMFKFGHATDRSKDFGCGTEYFNYLTKANSIHNEGPYANKFQPDSTWKAVTLPHDWAVDLLFSPNASYSHGFKTVGWKYPETSVGWYRKTFRLPESDKGKHISIKFDGIFRDAQIWVNGIYVGSEPSGYKHQEYDITDYLLFGDAADKENLVCVRCDASLEEGWFYEGAGIYRHVWLEKTDPLHVASSGTFIHSTLSDNYTKAEVTIETEVVNDNNTPVGDYRIVHEIIAPDGKVAATTEVQAKGLLPRESRTSATTVSLNNPMLWDTENPNLYNVKTRIYAADKLVDEYTTRTGIREIAMDCDKGLFVNGKHVKLKGFNCHQDHAGVGAAIPDGLQRYRMERLKWMGGNAYRASHNPMTPELLDVCDELGILVFEENRLLGINDYELSVMKNMIRHDRNHPSIFLWGIGNEEWGLEWDERSEQLAATMSEYANRADSTRMVGVASSGGPVILLGTDVAGYNYIRQHPIDEHRGNYPERIAMGSEETSGCGTRGVYFPCDPQTGHRIPININPADSLGFPMEKGWKFYDERPWLMGLFYWTGFDYRGEPVPLNYPATGSLFGILDYCGFPKDEAYYLKSWWGNEPVLHIMPHWNLDGHEGEEITTYVFSNCDEVELRVNGKSLGRKAMPRNGHLEWTAVYKPGYVQAIGYKNGKKIAEEKLETTGKAAKIATETHQYDNLYVINVSLKDAKNRFVPTASMPLNITISGDAKILGYGNGDSAFTGVERPTDPDAKTFNFSTFNGLAQILIEAPAGFTYTISGATLQPLTSSN